MLKAQWTNEQQQVEAHIDFDLDDSNEQQQVKAHIDFDLDNSNEQQQVEANIDFDLDDSNEQQQVEANIAFHVDGSNEQQQVEANIEYDMGIGVSSPGWGIVVRMKHHEPPKLEYGSQHRGRAHYRSRRRLSVHGAIYVAWLSALVVFDIPFCVRKI